MQYFPHICQENVVPDGDGAEVDRVAALLGDLCLCEPRPPQPAAVADADDDPGGGRPPEGVAEEVITGQGELQEGSLVRICNRECVERV